MDDEALPPEVIGVVTHHREGVFWRVPEVGEQFDPCKECMTTRNSELCRELPSCGEPDNSIFIRPEAINDYRVARVAAKLRG